MDTSSQWAGSSCSHFGRGDVFAELILLLEEPYPTSGRALTAVRLYKICPDTFWEMICKSRSILRKVMKISTQRSQIHEAVTQQQAKLISLATLSAGVAHELNHPDAAVRRGVDNLEEVLQTLPSLALKLHQQPLTEERIAFLCDLYQQATESAKESSRLDPLTQSELEDAAVEWLDAHDLPESWKLAPTLVAAGVDTERLDEVASNVAPECPSDVLSWLEAMLTGRGDC